LGMEETRYLPPDKACGPYTKRGAAIAWDPTAQEQVACHAGTWSTDLLSRIAPTARDEEGRADPSRNPDLDCVLRGTVHDTTPRRMGGVAGHPGVFSTAHDVSIYAQALLDRLSGRPSEFPLGEPTLEVITGPGEPGHTAGATASGVDEGSGAAGTYSWTTRCSERSHPRSRRKETEYNGSAAGSAVSGDQGTNPARLWL